jgi:hypothetical protein
MNDTHRLPTQVSEFKRAGLTVTPWQIAGTWKTAAQPSYQYKGPFALLEKEPSGAFMHSLWAIVEGLVTHVCARRAS